MDRLWLSAVECNYQEIDRQWKEQFIHRLNDMDMLGKIIRDLTKVKIGSVITSEDVLAWTKGVEVQRAQAVVMKSLEAKEFGKIKIAKNMYKDNLRSSTQVRMPMKQMYRYCGSSHPPRQCPVYGKTCIECSKIGQFRVVCRSRRTRAMNEVEQEAVQGDAGEDIELLSINSIQFNKNCSVLTANFKMSAGQSIIMVLYKTDSGSNGNIMPLHVYQKLFSSITNEQLAATENKNVLLKHITKLQ